MTVTLQLLYRYRPVLQKRYLPRPLQVQVRPIEIMSSQQPQILSIEDLNTADAKYILLFTYLSLQSKTELISLIFPKRWVSLKKINWQDQSGRTVGQFNLSSIVFSFSLIVLSI